MIVRALKLAVVFVILVAPTTPLAAAAEEKRPVHRVALVNSGPPANVGHSEVGEAFRQGLRELGYVEGQNITIEYRGALGISSASIRRYAAGERTTPDDIAARLHWLALVVGDLSGAYNEIGIRQWFERKRVQLGQRMPAQLLGGEWRPDDPGPQQVRALAYALTGSPAT